jgi:uncharacterized protein (TIGR02246 family)
MIEPDRLVDESDIRRLLAEYCHHYDDKRPGDFAALFTEDALFTVLDQRRTGRQEIHDHIGTQPSGINPGQHVTYNTVIEIATDGHTARAWTDFCYMSKTAAGLTISNAGRYHDHLVRDPDRWRFRTRTIVFLGDPVPDDA